MSPNTATNLRVSHEGFMCAVWHAVSAFNTCTHICVYVLLDADVLSLASAKDASSPLLIRLESMSLHQAAFSIEGHLPFLPCFNTNCCKLCTATEQLIITSEVHWLCLLGYISAAI